MRQGEGGQAGELDPKDRRRRERRAREQARPGQARRKAQRDGEADVGSRHPPRAGGQW